MVLHYHSNSTAQKKMVGIIPLILYTTPYGGGGREFIPVLPINANVHIVPTRTPHHNWAWCLAEASCERGQIEVAKQRPDSIA